MSPVRDQKHPRRFLPLVVISNNIDRGIGGYFFYAYIVTGVVSAAIQKTYSSPRRREKRGRREPFR
jgi:hypothetical protein